MNSEKAIQAVLQGLYAASVEGDANAYNQVSELEAFKVAAQHVAAGDTERFYFSLTYPIESSISGMLEKLLPGNDRAQFLFSQSRFVESHLEKLFEKHEGAACSVDKAGKVMDLILKHLLSGEHFDLSNEVEKAYYIPKAILQNSAQAMQLFDGLYWLYYGMPDKYLKAVVEMGL
ncbi:hypothetical protein RYA05_00050 [Pseudomonas syringae pv. actinidiae]|nr:hypothetical protein [Pseudomonas syringae pv. actinidiae]